MTTPNSQARPVAAPRNDLSRPTRRRLARAGVALATAPLLVLAACSSNDAPVANDTATVAGTGGTTSAEPAPTGEATTDAPTVAPAKQVIPVYGYINDPALGHRIQINQVVRNVPWPDGSPVSAEAFELVGVEMSFKAGNRYTAEIEPSMIDLTTPTTEKATAAATTEFKDLLGPALSKATRGKTTTGWLYFKVNRGDAAQVNPVTVSYNRPEYFVSTTKKKIAPRTGLSVVVLEDGTTAKKPS